MIRRRLSIHHQGEAIEYTLVHRPRVTRRVHLELGEEGGLNVVKPRRMSQRAVQKLLQENTEWVVRFLESARSRQNELAPKVYVSGEWHLYLGERYPLRVAISAGARPGVRLEPQAIRVHCREAGEDEVRDRLRAWYRQQAMAEFSRRLERISERAPWVGSVLPPLRLRRMKRTWGSCSSKGVITLNPHLVKAPPELIDYVIAHEICHLVEHNHGRGFYRLQDQLNPQWRGQRDRLRSRGHLYLHE